MSKLIKEFEALEDDYNKWKWLINKQGLGLKVICDNDSTFLVDEADEDSYADFSNYIGCSQGMFTLLEVMGINSEEC